MEKSRVWVCGDTHGNFDFLQEFCTESSTSKEEVLIVLGDAGILYYGNTNSREIFVKKQIEACPITLFCVRGNHESRPEGRDEIIIQHIDGIICGDVYVDPQYPHILYAMDGGEYTINGKSTLVVGGAYSVDKYYRQMRNWFWAPDEMLTQEEMNRILNQVHGKHFDYVLTHTCPFDWMPIDLFIPGIKQSTVRQDMEYFLNTLKEEIDFDRWYFGHYHNDRHSVCGDRRVTMLFNDIEELGATYE